MNDSKGVGIYLLQVLIKILVFIPALYQGLKISIQNKTLGDYGYSLGIGGDIFGNKLIAPHANKYWVKPGGRLYGGNETISVTMAYNKHFGFNTGDADKWERRINILDRDHLAKTYKKYELNKNLN